jgi:hypothetical protein
VSGIVVYNGHSVIAALDLHIDAAPRPTTFAWRVGAVPEHRLCGLPLGWRLDLDDKSNESTDTPPNEGRDLRLRATSRDRPACDAKHLVAQCGDTVSVLVMTGDDDIVAALDTTFECFVPARPPR